MPKSLMRSSALSGLASVRLPDLLPGIYFLRTFEKVCLLIRPPCVPFSLSCPSAPRGLISSVTGQRASNRH